MELATTNEEKPTIVGVDDIKKTIKSPTSKSKLVVMEDIQLEDTELGFVTSIYQPTRTFFIQMCKFPNEDLLLFNETLNNYCNEIYDQRVKGSNPTKAVPKKVHGGDILCAPYSADNCWYRAQVLSYDKTNRKCLVLYVDYGNIETVLQNDLVEIRPDELKLINRSPFGITCFLKDSQCFSEKKINHLLDCLLQNYVMVKIKERQTTIQWTVEIPENCYNTTFLVVFKKEEFDDDRDEDDNIQVKRQCLDAGNRYKGAESGQTKIEEADKKKTGISANSEQEKKEGGEKQETTVGKEESTQVSAATTEESKTPAPAPIENVPVAGS